jgi:tetratricopeptide (TPR) repeat protein
MTTNKRFRDAITKSIELEKLGERGPALEILDHAIAEAIGDDDGPWIRTLCHHAAILSRSTEDLPLAKRYYEQSLASDPENARALYGLAAVALDEGDAATARQYAIRCHTALLRSDDEILKVALFDLISKNWPDLFEK